MILTTPHSEEQDSFVHCLALRQIIRAGRRFGKTVGAAIKAGEAFLGVCPGCSGKGCLYCQDTGKVEPERVLYAAPVKEQVDVFWYEITRALRPAIELGIFKKNETEHFIEKPGTQLRIQARTAWNADMLRGGFWGLLILEEYQLMNEDVWEVVGQPMLLDRNGRAVFIYTPPSLRSAGISKAHDPRHAAKMYKMALADKTGDWQAFHFTSHQNPILSIEALSRITIDMTKEAYMREILAEDDEIQLSWLVYKAFNEINKIDDFEIPKNWLIYAGHDFGGANPAALFVAQDPATGNFYEFKEYLPGSGKSTYEHIEEFKRITEGYNVIWRSGGSHQEEEIRQGYSSQGWSIIEPKVRGVNPQIDRVIGFMERNKIFIFKSLYNRLEEIMNCLWQPDSEGRPTDKIKDEQKYHLCACARYLYSNFMPETVYRGVAVAVSNH